jgi:uncharacterized membrane protein YeaQ/YmgE (transglycosylase-associated protein family)
MSILVSVPLGLMFGLVSWAMVRGRGGLFGLFLFAVFGSVGAFTGGLAAEAITAGASDAVTGLGALAGATLAVVVEMVGFGKRPLVV